MVDIRGAGTMENVMQVFEGVLTQMILEPTTFIGDDGSIDPPVIEDRESMAVYKNGQNSGAGGTARVNNLRAQEAEDPKYKNRLSEVSTNAANKKWENKSTEWICTACSATYTTRAKLFDHKRTCELNKAAVLAALRINGNKPKKKRKMS